LKDNLQSNVVKENSSKNDSRQTDIIFDQFLNQNPCIGKNWFLSNFYEINSAEVKLKTKEVDLKVLNFFKSTCDLTLNVITRQILIIIFFKNLQPRSEIKTIFGFDAINKF